MSSIIVSWTPGHKYSTLQDGQVKEISKDYIQNMFLFALPGGLNISQAAAAEWIVEFPGKDENYTSTAMKNAEKDQPWSAAQEDGGGKNSIVGFNHSPLPGAKISADRDISIDEEITFV